MDEFVIVRGLIVGYASMLTTENECEDLEDRTALFISAGFEAMVPQLARSFPQIRWQIIDLNGR